MTHQRTLKRMAIETKQIITLRRRTGVGLADCVRALEQTHGDLEAAVVYLREQGTLNVAKKFGHRTAGQGVVAAYVHAGGQVGALVVVRCETDFVARNADFLQFAHTVAMQVAAAHPLYLSPTDVPAEMVEQERAIYREQIRQSGKPTAAGAATAAGATAVQPDHLAEKIVAGKLEQFYRQTCLLQQAYIKDETRTVQAVVAEQAAKLGEKIVIEQFVRFQI